MKRLFGISITAALLLIAAGCKKEPASEAQVQQQLQEAQKKVEQAEQQAAEARRQLEEAQQKAAQAPAQGGRSQTAPAHPGTPGAPQAPGSNIAQAQGSAAPAPAAGTHAVSPSSAPEPAPKTITLPEGAKIVVRTTTALSTKDMTAGERFAATLHEPLVADGITLAPKGAEVEGVIVESDPGGRVKGVAQLSVALRSIQTTAGKVTIQTGAYVTEAKSSVKKDVTRGAIMTGVGAAIGAIAGGGKGAAVGAGVGAGAGAATAMATRGEPATIPAESVLTFRLKAPVTVTVK
jgi:hypothetical protein